MEESQTFQSNELSHNIPHFAVFCSGDNSYKLLKNEEEVEKEKIRLIKHWSGSGVFPLISVFKITEATEVY